MLPSALKNLMKFLASHSLHLTLTWSRREGARWPDYIINNTSPSIRNIIAAGTHFLLSDLKYHIYSVTTIIVDQKRTVGIEVTRWRTEINDHGLTKRVVNARFQFFVV